MLHAHLHLNNALIRRTSGQSLGTFKRGSSLSDIGGALKRRILRQAVHTEVIVFCCENHAHNKNTLCAQDAEFLGPFAWSRKAPFNLVMSTHLSVHLAECISASPTGRLCQIWYWGCLWKSVKKPQILLKSGTNIEHFTWRPKYVLLLQATLNLHNSALCNCNRIRLLSVRPCPSVYLSVSPRLSLYGFTWSLILGTSMKIRREIPDLIKIWHKFRALCMKT
jgi:hypothetical protein